MEFLGIGPLELLLILFFALIFIGPKDMAKTGRAIGRTLRKIVMSPQWRVVSQTSREIRNLPNRLIREAGLEEVEQDVRALKQTTAEIQNSLSQRSLLPPDWPGAAAKTDPQNKPATIGEGKSPETPPSPASEAQPGLQAWTGGPPMGAPGTSPDQPDYSAWITPPGQEF